jgi:hypothetical protein
MAIVQTATTSFKVELFQAVHNFGPTSPDTFKIALYTSVASIGYATTAYNVGLAGQVANGSGYTTGGKTLTISVSPTYGNNSGGIPTSYFSFQNISWPNSSFTTRGALIYNTSKSNKSVAVLDFNADLIVNNDTFTVIFPTPDPNNAIVRIY